MKQTENNSLFISFCNYFSI